MSETLTGLLLRLSEAGEPALLWGRLAAPHAGPAFERLLDRGVLIERAPATEWDVCLACDCDLHSRPIERIDGQNVAVCPTDRRSAVVLDSDDLRSFRIHAPALVREIALASGFGDEPSAVVPGVWHLGQTPSQRALFLALAREAVLQAGVIGLMRSVTRSLPITLISPAISADAQTRFAEAGLLIVPIGECFALTGGAAPFAIDPANLEPPSQLDARLVIRRTGKFVALDGVSSTLSDQTFRLLGLLAERALTDDPYAAPRDVEARIWGSSVHRVSRDARDVVRELRDALAIGAQNPAAVRRLIENRRNRGWRLTLSAAEIALRD